MNSIRATGRIVALESRYEIVKLLRTPAFIVPTVAFPVVFYLLFGVLMGSRAAAAGTTLGAYLIATYGAFGVIGAALSSFGISVSIERAQGLLQLKHATPMPLFAYIVGKLAAAMLFAAVIVLALVATGAALNGVRIAWPVLATLVGTLVAGTIPFALLGLTIGYMVTGQASIAAFNLVFLPMAFVSGLWIPIDFLPRTVQQLASYVPAYHLGQLALGAAQMPSRGTAAGHVLALVGFTLFFAATATAAYTRDRRNNYA